jgi:hypothetical protein
MSPQAMAIRVEVLLNAGRLTGLEPILQVGMDQLGQHRRAEFARRRQMLVEIRASARLPRFLESAHPALQLPAGLAAQVISRS